MNHVKHFFHPSVRVLSVMVLSLFTAGSLHATESDTMIINNVTLIRGDGSAPILARRVEITAGRITAIEDALSDTAPEGQRVIEAEGGVLVPGFIDTHAHVALGPVSLTFEDKTPVFAVNALPELTSVSMQMLLAHGVTTARDPGGQTEWTLDARNRQQRGTLTGPRLQVAGNLIDLARFDNLVSQVDSPDAVRAEVEHQASLGVDWIKLYTSLPEHWTGVAIDTAHGLGLKVTGHLESTTWAEAAAMGIDSLVHIIPGSEHLLPESRQAEYRASRTLSLYMLRWFEWVDLEAEPIQSMINTILEHGVSIDPTLVLFHSMVHGDQPTYLENPALDAMPEEMLENWRTLFHFNIGWTDSDFETARKIWPRVQAFTRLLHERGVMLTAGTDANNPWIVPGESYHRELELLVDAGIPALDVLTIATLNGARLMGLDKEIGSIEIGKRADLVLLNADPLVDIRHTRQIAWVMQDGHIVSGSAR